MKTYGDLYNYLKDNRPEGITVDDLSASKLLWIATAKKEQDLWETTKVSDNHTHIKKVCHALNENSDP